LPHSTKSAPKPAPSERIVVDTGVVISAAFGGIPLEALEAAREHPVIVSPAMVAELAAVIAKLRRKLGDARHAKLQELARMLVLGAEWVEPTIRVDLCRDPNDAMFLEACLAGKATVLLSGDKDLTSLKAADLEAHDLGDVRILTPAQFVRGVAD
jgi:putative PIN family toxin of toxin-antitoxin system